MYSYYNNVLKINRFILKSFIVSLLFMFLAWPVGRLILWLVETGYSFLLWVVRTVRYIAKEFDNFLLDVGIGIKNMFIGSKDFLIAQISESIEVIKAHAPNLEHITRFGILDEFCLGGGFFLFFFFLFWVFYRGGYKGIKKICKRAKILIMADPEILKLLLLIIFVCFGFLQTVDLIFKCF
ncbi:MAG: hypothetical protein HRT87_07405 [Legionellales bacterium]|nr:hypothetical protein [Legionellales bacterium]